MGFIFLSFLKRVIPISVSFVQFIYIRFVEKPECNGLLFLFILRTIFLF